MTKILHPMGLVGALLAGPLAAQDTLLPDPVVDAGYEAGFDFEALGIMGSVYRLGRTYYDESVDGARALDAAVAALLADPGPETLAEARAAWAVARTPYLRTEVFGHVLPEVAAWQAEMAVYSGPLPDLPDAAAGLIPEIELSAGYAGIELALWGSNQGATRTWADFALPGDCAEANCAVLRTLVREMSAGLVADLEEMAALWQPGAEVTVAILSETPHDIVERMVLGAAAFTAAELAAVLDDPAALPDLASGQTHRALLHSFEGVQMIFAGAYVPSEGFPDAHLARMQRRLPGGTHLLSLYKDGEIAADAFAEAEAALRAIHASAEAGTPVEALVAADDADPALIEGAQRTLARLSRALQALHDG